MAGLAPKALSSICSTHTLLRTLTNGHPILAYEALLDITGEYRSHDINHGRKYATLLDDTVIEMTMYGRADDAQSLRKLCDSVAYNISDTSILFLLLMCGQNIQKKKYIIPPAFFGALKSNCPENVPTIKPASLPVESHPRPDVFREPHASDDAHQAIRNGHLTLRPLSSKDRFDCIADAARLTLEQRSLWTQKKVWHFRKSPSATNHQPSLLNADRILRHVHDEYYRFCRKFKPLPNTAALPVHLPPSSRDIDLLHTILSRCISGFDEEDLPVMSATFGSRPLLARTCFQQSNNVNSSIRRMQLRRHIQVNRRHQALRARQEHFENSPDAVTLLMARAATCGSVYCDIASFTDCYSDAVSLRVLRAVVAFSYKIARSYFQALLAVIADDSVPMCNKPFAVVHTAELFVANGIILTDILQHVEDTDGSSVAIVNLLMVEATEHPTNEMVQLLFCSTISPYFASVWDWVFEGSVRRDIFGDFFGSVVGLSPNASEQLENARTAVDEKESCVGIYPDLFSKEEALFILRAGRCRYLLRHFGLHRGTLAERPADIDFGNTDVCIDGVFRGLTDLANRVSSSCVLGALVSSATPGRTGKYSTNCQNATPILSSQPICEELSNDFSSQSVQSTVSLSDCNIAQSDQELEITRTFKMNASHEVLLDSSTGNSSRKAKESPSHPIECTESCSVKPAISKTFDQDVRNGSFDCHPKNSGVHGVGKSYLNCSHSMQIRKSPDADNLGSNPTCVCCTAFKIPEGSGCVSLEKPKEYVNMFSTIHDEESSHAEEVLQRNMPATRRKPRFPSPVLLSSQLLAPLRKIDKVVQKEVLHHFVYQLRLFDHLRNLRAHVLLGAGDFANELVEQLEIASRTADANERFIHRRSNASMTFYGGGGVGEKYVRNQAHLNRCLKTALNLYSVEGNPLADLLQLDSESTTVERGENDRRISAGQSSFWESKMLVRYDVVYPLNVVITEDSMRKYSSIFGLFLRILRARRSLRSLFLISRRIRVWNKELLRDRKLAERIWSFCCHAEHFVSIFGGFEMEQVLGGCWTDFENGWATAKSIWELRDSHSAFLEGCIRRCLLGEKHRSVLKVMTGGFEIVVNVDRDVTRVGLADATSSSTEVMNVMDLLVSATASLKRRCAFLTDVLERLLENGNLPHLEHLLTQLNFNHYYQKKLAVNAVPQTTIQLEPLTSQLWQTGRQGSGPL